MPRRPRIHLAGLPIHLVKRGHNRDACFFTDEDFMAYQEWLGEALTKTGCALHAYVLMTNHVHLLLTPPSAEAVSQMVISLGRRYVQYINKTYRPTGTLWGSRYKSSLVHADDYLLCCQRYIEHVARTSSRFACPVWNTQTVKMPPAGRGLDEHVDQIR